MRCETYEGAVVYAGPQVSRQGNSTPFASLLHETAEMFRVQYWDSRRQCPPAGKRVQGVESLHKILKPLHLDSGERSQISYYHDEHLLIQLLPLRGPWQHLMVLLEAGLNAWLHRSTNCTFIDTCMR